MFKESENIVLKETFAEWKEIIISLVAFANRKGDAGNIQVRIFDNKLEIWSPGLLPRELDITRLETECRSIARNKKIAELFYKLGMIENWGTGIARMINNY